MLIRSAKTSLTSYDGRLIGLVECIKSRSKIQSAVPGRRRKQPSHIASLIALGISPCMS